MINTCFQFDRHSSCYGNHGKPRVTQGSANGDQPCQAGRWQIADLGQAVPFREQCGHTPLSIAEDIPLAMPPGL